MGNFEVKLRKVGDYFIFGPKVRAIFPVVVVCNGTRAHWVFFIVNTGSLFTYLSARKWKMVEDIGLSPTDWRTGEFFFFGSSEIYNNLLIEFLMLYNLLLILVRSCPGFHTPLVRK
ncbi:hypothetical protein L873DRAFT_288243 [Choiromyces venosus 120613-1]|uniref:Uncharacterized protein n=1 Tax=Choiromyces venosus 120613-1 TaxID=1336337 RepID=A0A3N4JXX1_9PEZI|nr:hypothetical protein L873DRAFT_288243 [Choiromyces venosus 120613-1]